MPVYFITVHTYRSWREDNPRGYIQRGKPGVQKPNSGLAHSRAASSSDSPVRLDAAQITLVLDGLHEVCQKLGVSPYAGSCTPTHWHLLAGWIDPIASFQADHPEPKITAEQLVTRLKRVVGQKLSASLGQSGARWFSRGWHIERIDRQEHFEHLLDSYLPKHISEGGRFIHWH